CRDQPTVRLGAASPMIPCFPASSQLPARSPTCRFGERETINQSFAMITTYDPSLFITDFFLGLQHLIGLHIPLCCEPALAAQPMEPALPLGARQIVAGEFGRTRRRG